METAVRLPSPSNAGVADLRRERKRAHDRRAQRVARERTKNRIAELEATVAALRQQGSDNRSAGLVEQLGAVTTERDELAAVLPKVEAALRKYTERTGGKTREGHRGGGVTSTGPEPDHQTPQHQQSPNKWPQTPALDSNVLSLVHGLGSRSSKSYRIGDAIAITHGEEPIRLQTSVGAWSAPMLGSPSNISWTKDSILPRSEIPCDCSPQPLMTEEPEAHGNIWRSANSILSEPHELSEAEMRYEDTMREDIAVRVISEGWDTVERSIQLPPIWKKLRMIDELQFCHCADTERLAVLSTMHLMLRSYADPNPVRLSKLPSWMQKRPCQLAISHSYAIDFFVWPGLRERFIFSQHHYCSNSFWKHFTANLMILWPYEFRDCYRRNLETGRISISNEFKTRIADLNAWTMCPDFFQQFPDLYVDIPASKTIPRQLSVHSIMDERFTSNFDYEQSQERERTKSLSSQIGPDEATSVGRDYSDVDWVGDISQLESNLDHTMDHTVDGGLQFCFL